MNDANILNNIDSIVSEIIDTKIFDGLYLDYSYNLNDYLANSSIIIYTQISGQFFHAYWDIDNTLRTNWEINVKTRMMKNSAGPSSAGLRKWRVLMIRNWITPHFFMPA